MTETWKPVVGYEGRYEVSDLGRVRSLDCVVVCERSTGPVNRRYVGRVLRPGRASNGYATVALPTDVRQQSVPVQYLVLEAFVGPRPTPKHQCCHANGIRDDNRLVNLRWDTPAENANDKRRHGTLLLGERAPGAVLGAAEVHHVRQSNESAETLAQLLGCSASNIYKIRSRKSWRHV